jgi:hypothetical protein
MINHSCSIPKGVIITKSGGFQYISTPAMIRPNKEIDLNYLSLPKFSVTCHFGNIKYYVFDTQCNIPAFKKEKEHQLCSPGLCF